MVSLNSTIIWFYRRCQSLLTRRRSAGGPDSWYKITDGLIGLCLPALCTANDSAAISDYLNETLRFPSFDAPVMISVRCLDRPSLPLGGVLVLALGGLLLLLVAAASLLRWTSAIVRQVVAERTTASNEQIERAPLVLEAEEHAPVPASRWRRLLDCFAVQANLEKLVSEEGSAYDALNGLRFFSLAAVMWGHTFSANRGFQNMAAFWVDGVRSPAIQILISYAYGVDTFFWLSGFLVALPMLKALDRGTFRWLHHFVHRFVRLTPVLAYWVFFTWKVLPYLSYGPL